MRGMVLGLLGGLVLAGAANAQSPSPEACTIPKEGVKTWTAEIDGKEYEAHPATPAYDGSTGLFHLPSAYTLPKGRASVSLFRDNLDRDPKDEDISIHGVNLAIGATSRLELFGSFGFQNRIDADALFQPGFVNDFPFVNVAWQTGPGDLKLGLKYKVLDDYHGAPLALALRGYFKVPTGDENKGLGTGKSAYGFDLLVSKSLGRAADLHAAVGYQWNHDPELPQPVNIGNAFKWGVGLNVPACRRIQLQAEVTGSTYEGASFKQTNPVDLVGGPVIWLWKGFFIRPAISKNLNFDDRGLNQGAKSSMGRQFSIGYHPGTACCAVAAPASPPRSEANRAPTASCDVERATIAPGETVGLRATATDPDRDNLTYTWSTSGGRITGFGPSVTLDTSGLRAPATITTTVRVSDGRGGVADARCSVGIPVPERRPETVSCDSVGFPLNLARLNNVDKACLDDVASRLRQDPRSRVVIVGRAASNEQRPDVVSRQRGEAAKAYLVHDRNVEESRVSARGAGATRPREAGASPGNRRVEVIFVPEGAPPPPEN